MVRSGISRSYAVGVAGWLNALAATLDLDGVELGLGGDGHGGGDVDAKIYQFSKNVLFYLFVGTYSPDMTISGALTQIFGILKSYY